MGERKVINKYFPPDFDPSKIPRPDKRQQEKVKEKFVVRMMLPMSVRCQSCGEYMYKGKKFNSRKESVEGPEGQYLGIQIFRFYFKCITCSAEFTIKTDPQNMDYVCEGGAKANFELYKEENKEKEEIKTAREEDEKYDAMKKLENKTQEQKNAMDILDALDEIRTNNARAATLGVDGVLNARDEMFVKQEAKVQSREEAEDEAALKAAFAGSRVKRMAAEDEEEEEEEEDLRRGSSTAGVASTHATTTAAASSSSKRSFPESTLGTATTTAAAAAAPSKKPKLPMGLSIQAKPAAQPPRQAALPPPPEPETKPGGLLGLVAYGSSGSGSGSDGET